MEPSLAQEELNMSQPENTYRPPQRPPKPKALIAFTAISCILAIASITFCVFVAMQTMDKTSKITDIESKITSLESQIAELSQKTTVEPGTTTPDGALTYKIVGQDGDGSAYSQKGYYVEEQTDGSAKVIISLGEQNSGGSKIVVSEVEIDGDEAIIYVEEVSVNEIEPIAMTDAYPTTVVQFNKVPASLSVKSVDGTTEFMEMSGAEIQISE